MPTSNMLEIELVVLTIAEGKLRLLASSRGLPACTLGRAEPLDRAAARLLREEVSADHLYLEQLYTFVLRRGRVVVGYLALVRNAQIKRAGAVWHPAQPLPNLRNGQRIVAEYGLTRLRSK